MSLTFDLAGEHAELILRAFCHEKSTIFLLSKIEKLLRSDDLSLTRENISIKRSENFIKIIFEDPFPADPWCVITIEEVCDAFIELCEDYDVEATCIAMDEKLL